MRPKSGAVKGLRPGIGRFRASCQEVSPLRAGRWYAESACQVLTRIVRLGVVHVGVSGTREFGTRVTRDWQRRMSLAGNSASDDEIHAKRAPGPWVSAVGRPGSCESWEHDSERR